MSIKTTWKCEEEQEQVIIYWKKGKSPDWLSKVAAASICRYFIRINTVIKPIRYSMAACELGTRILLVAVKLLSFRTQVLMISSRFSCSLQWYAMSNVFFMCKLQEDDWNPMRRTRKRVLRSLWKLLVTSKTGTWVVVVAAPCLYIFFVAIL